MLLNYHQIHPMGTRVSIHPFMMCQCWHVLRYPRPLSLTNFMSGLPVDSLCCVFMSLLPVCFVCWVSLSVHLAVSLPTFQFYFWYLIYYSLPTNSPRRFDDGNIVALVGTRLKTHAGVALPFPHAFQDHSAMVSAGYHVIHAHNFIVYCLLWLYYRFIWVMLSIRSIYIFRINSLVIRTIVWLANHLWSSLEKHDLVKST